MANLLNDEQAMHSIRILKAAGYTATEVERAMRSLEANNATSAPEGFIAVNGFALLRDQQSGFVALPEDAPPRFNGGIRCDMLVRTCACGAWHKENEGAMF